MNSKILLCTLVLSCGAGLAVAQTTTTTTTTTTHRTRTEPVLTVPTVVEVHTHRAVRHPAPRRVVHRHVAKAPAHKTVATATVNTQQLGGAPGSTTTTTTVTHNASR